MTSTPRLIVVGTGIAPGHLTADARRSIEQADRVLYGVGSPLTERLIKRLQPDAESLLVHYGEGKPRTETYAQMVDRILECVRGGGTVCVALYGHPGIFVYPAHEAIRRARREGYEAVMLPAVSSLDCLFADLGVDPGHGCQMYEATDLLLSRRPLDPSAEVIVWQIGCVGRVDYRADGDAGYLPILVEYLLGYYRPDHPVTVYEAPWDPRAEPVIRASRLADLAGVPVSLASTLYIPPGRPREIDQTMLERLGLSLDQFQVPRPPAP